MRCYRETGRPKDYPKPIPEMTREEVNRELCERLGVPAHGIDTKRGDAYKKKNWMDHSPPVFCTCGRTSCELLTPDFYSDPGKVQLLREMVKHPKATEFKIWLWKQVGWLMFTGSMVISVLLLGVPYIFLIDEDGLFAKAALDYLRKADGDN